MALSYCMVGHAQVFGGHWHFVACPWCFQCVTLKLKLKPNRDAWINTLLWWIVLLSLDTQDQPVWQLQLILNLQSIGVQWMVNATSIVPDVLDLWVVRVGWMNALFSVQAIGVGRLDVVLSVGAVRSRWMNALWNVWAIGAGRLDALLSTWAVGAPW